MTRYDYSSLTRQAPLWSKVWMYHAFCQFSFPNALDLCGLTVLLLAETLVGRWLTPRWGPKIWKLLTYLQLHPDSPDTVPLRKVQGVMFQNMIPEPKKKATRGAGTWGEGKGTALRSAVFVSTLLPVNQLVFKLGGFTYFYISFGDLPSIANHHSLVVPIHGIGGQFWRGPPPLWFYGTPFP